MQKGGKMILQLALVCCAIPCIAAGNTLFFKPHADPSFKNFTCPDQTQCPVGNTCCQTTQNQFGCCPYPNAVCCSDGVHCCQSGASCHPSGVGCVHQRAPELPPKPIRTDTVKGDLEVLGTGWCPDKEVMCPKGKTCCQGLNQEYACCPFPEAVCCSDGAHCCPNGTTCDMPHGKCNADGRLSVPWLKKRPALKKEKDVMCDSDHSCPGNDTCCKRLDGTWGCCPFPKAVCCPDHAHCCPEGNICDMARKSCQKGGVVTAWMEKTSAIRKDVGDIQCDATHECVDGDTCCMMANHQWGCCPMPQAVCCSDGAHCCPNGTTCDMPHGKCNAAGGMSVPWLKKRPALKKEKDVMCDSDHSCPGNDTCCKRLDGTWGCCPFPKAVCCPDHAHCCPEGNICDMARKSCQKGVVTTAWMEKTSAIRKDVGDIQCDATHECVDGDTCCMMANHQWGCCPMPQAVCCSDGAHCCPNGTTCDMPHGKCNAAGGMSVPWLKKRPALKKEKDVMCDSDHSCPGNDTCCKRLDGTWGCCPFPKAVCCPDHAHCCPEGNICDMARKSCQKGVVTTAWMEKTSAIRKDVGDIQCDATHECVDGDTCCMMANHQWGCCPMPQAVCCSDGAHCCPNGTTCDMPHGKCNAAGGMSVPWLKKRPALKKEKDVMCDSDHSCPGNDTCCKRLDGTWGCCPFPKAVCCPDHAHCCPEGNICDMARKSCQKGGVVTAWMEKTSAIRKDVGDIQCDATHECVDGDTCCMMANHQWGCCPMPQAVCCSDGAHCCPNGTTCDMPHGKCNAAGGMSVPWLKKRPALKKEKDVMCDSDHSCPGNDTCCKRLDGTWGCCPFPKAVCCPDHAHCCPEGNICDMARKSCQKGVVTTAWMEKTSAIRKDVGDIQCDATHECVDGDTCCMMANHQWGCCPMPQAVCCSDGAHCCPNGTTCDMPHGKCNAAGGMSVPWLKKRPALKKEKDVMCDSDHSCPGNDTCCKRLDGTWGCCPFPKAVCCPDHAHCCPEGNICDMARKSCQKGVVTTAWMEKTSAIRKDVGDIQCDATHECVDGDTCCMMANHQWGCCPMPQAVCCSDGAHCCPNGTTCDMPHGKCNADRGLSVPWLKKRPALKREKDVMCDSDHSCPGNDTCCKRLDGTWGCCPFPKAVCCPDHAHCCPEGNICDMARKSCQKGVVTTAWMEKTSAIRKDVGDIQCDATHECVDGDTCCMMANHQWGCCPMPQAVCCSDGAHCCPNGTTCDMPHGKCNAEGGVSVPWLKKHTALKKEKDVMCDSSHYCPGNDTCCKRLDGSWGCCSFPKAVCCSDGAHCCPNGTTCDIPHDKCNAEGGMSVPWLKKRPALKKMKDVMCDPRHFCPGNDTCCKRLDGTWGCCSFPKAVCCPDKVHCCPSGTTCDSSAGRCNRHNGIAFPWMQRSSSSQSSGGLVITDPGTDSDRMRHKTLMHVEEMEASVVCPGGETECPSGSTCCQLASGDWGCCPIPQAVCCSDHIHCCPSGMTCDVSAGKCNKDGISITWEDKRPARARKMQHSGGQANHPSSDKSIKSQKDTKPLGNVMCPDKKSSCPDNSSCCSITKTQFGCCPHPKAVCCSDGIHCCPEYMICNLTSQTCDGENGHISLPLYRNTPSRPLPKPSSIQCGGGFECPDGNTCCRMVTGQWGCCPMPQAVCCPDRIHCCPQGSTCSAGSCISDSITVPWAVKTLATRTVLKTPDPGVFTCNGTQKQCNDGDTCCRAAQGYMACCTFSNAVCCSDGTHCCPQGTTCDVESGHCLQSDNERSIALTLKKVVSQAVDVNNVMCDSTYECPDGNTCCKLSSGQWGCCPLPKAVCCSDGIHCCPEGTTCDTASGKCNKQDGLSITWFKKTAPIVKNVENVMCDSTHECPDGTTCCKLYTGEWGCCRMSNAVCCSDGMHCCPEGTTCDLASGTCITQDGLSRMWFKKTAPIVKNVENIMCDSTHECPDRSTCCKLSSGEWGCCPLPKAVCCSDGIHCCPEGTTCDTASGKCNKQDGLSITWFKKTAPIVKNVENVMCDSTHQCPDGSTCCKLYTGEWGCCPLPKAVCCPDRFHCCPEGTTCNSKSGRCDRQDGLSIKWFKKTAPIAKYVENIMCDSTHECPDGSTCCKLSSGEWGCCPLPEAVCCSDGIHCCPEGTTCDTASGKCNKQDGLSITWFKKTAPIVKNVENIMCDSTHECPDRSTCCKLSSGEWGCCPLPKAVCCSDGIHCCPEGTTCDTASGKCNKQDGLSITWFKKTAPIVKNVENIMCDSTHECPDRSTCCKLSSGEWGCCPLPKAVCCSDGIHCCPEGTTCDTASGKCNKQDGLSITWFKKTAPIVKNVENIMCDSTHECPDRSTCCKLSSGEWGCCPLPKAVCCSDGIHCCPEGTTCDTASGRCNKQDGLSLTWFKKTAPIVKNVENIMCDSTHECPDGTTCCKLSSGEWGCCPLPKAVCCSDGIHCCPEGTTCDTASGTCNKQDGLSVTWFKKTAPIVKNVENIMCDSSHECPDRSTCCKLSSGEWGCCPLPKAVCCSDGIHCCPEGTTCDTASGRCNKQDGLSLTWFKKTAPIVKNVENIMCDSTHECPDRSTCCKLSSGEWGCCPLPKAVCCSDGIHCCPEGTTCDTASGRCNKQDGLSLTWFKKTAPIVKNVENVMCDSTHQCPDGSTCCKLSSGEWGCCPLPKAVCCSDGIHCCPEGTTCDTASGRCNKQDGLSVTWFKKTAPIVKNVENIMCDSSHQCPDGSTCCKLSSGEWGCCPLPKAVCCSDGIHCCPEGTTCDTASGRCNKQDGLSLTWFKKTAPIVKNVENVMCDSTHECPDGSTCCKLLSGEWGCCPLLKAVCCSDGVHCCPEGTTCSPGSGLCKRPDGYSVNWLKKNPTISKPLKKLPKIILPWQQELFTKNGHKVKDITCNDSSKCPDGSTCCQLQNNSYGCCPEANAVCCEDKIHCCPVGYHCAPTTGFCWKNNATIPILGYRMP
ncbi:zonadhesin-like isoform X1 [Haliotis asinina]|uniref:zonadhesin-like isoform X1 n=1 Tax=Haliotis asinina TaxID=109174 RepID=UPI0035323128